ncbi:MAG: 50S ribosomal protein L4 [Verrucomicrobiaceae bacterium]|nr:50S ribosomal protein L4 [Verrucomicrobiaceae bacterium]
MAANTLSPDAAKAANLNLVEGYKGAQALHNTVVAYRANRRAGTASTKGRGAVRGSGKKLWNQKGTGNARMGSRRSPIWVGGGVAWGPKPRDYSKTIPKKVKKLAFRTALTARINDGDVLTIGAFAIPDGKTKSFVSSVKGLSDARKILIVGKFDEPTFRAGRNVQAVQLISPDDVNAEHLLNFDKVLVTSDSLETLARRTA